MVDELSNEEYNEDDEILDDVEQEEDDDLEDDVDPEDTPDEPLENEGTVGLE